jgi:hypothetical protein
VVGLDPLLERHVRNAVVSWLLVGVLGATVVERLLSGETLQAVFAIAAVALALVAPVLARDPIAMPAWPVLAVSALPAVALVVGAFVEPATYLAVAALGLLVVAEIDRFSAARMPGWFAAAMVVMATMTVANAWTVLRYGVAAWFGAGYETTVDALMWDLVVATTVAVVTGVLFAATLREAEVVADGR